MVGIGAHVTRNTFGRARGTQMALFDGLFGRRKAALDSVPSPPPDPQQVYSDLRSQALRWTPDMVGVPDASDAVFGVLIDWTAPSGMTFTTVSMADGTTSAYTTTGAGVIGVGATPAVAAASKRLVAAAESMRAAFRPEWQDGPLSEEQIRLIVLTRGGPLAAVAGLEELGSGGNPLSGVFFLANEVFTQIRKATTQ